MSLVSWYDLNTVGFIFQCYIPTARVQVSYIPILFVHAYHTTLCCQLMLVYLMLGGCCCRRAGGLGGRAAELPARRAAVRRGERRLPAGALLAQHGELRRLPAARRRALTPAHAHPLAA